MPTDSSSDKPRAASPAAGRRGSRRAAGKSDLERANEETATFLNDDPLLRGVSPEQALLASSAVRADWLADTLRQRIIRGIYKPGDRIREAALQDEFGLSNGPIREGLQQIVADGIAERAPWRGVRVVELTDAQICELFQVRLALLEYAAELAAKADADDKASSADELKRRLDATFRDVHETNGQRHPSFNGELSNWLFGLAGNGMLQSMWRGVMLRTLPYINRSIHMSAGDAIHQHLWHLIDAIVAGDVAAARRAARDLTRQALVDLNLDPVL